VVSGAVNAENLTEGTLTALDGTTILVSTTGEITFDQTARPADTDIPASNGVIHTIDTVLLPPDVDPSTLVTTTTTVPAQLLYTVYFTTTARVMTDDGKEEVKLAAEAIKALPAGSTVKVVGYTMQSGTAGNQRFIARLRAKVVVAALKRAGATNVEYVIRTVIGLPRSGSKTKARRAEIQMPGYTKDGATTTTSSTSSTSSTSTTMAP
jgi:outer membrane protein OmpA-like peptidoglycan-associated protein